MFNLLFVVFFSGVASHEQEFCVKAIKCSIFTTQQFSMCVLCVESIYEKHKNSVPFTKKQIFNYIKDLSCENFKDKIEYYKVNACVNQR